jgi:hypothetical protein
VYGSERTALMCISRVYIGFLVAPHLLEFYDHLTCDNNFFASVAGYNNFEKSDLQKRNKKVVHVHVLSYKYNISTLAPFCTQ